MICPICLSEIDDDSAFCDQCGEKIFICPACGKAGSGGYCFADGNKLVQNSGDKNFTQKKFFQTARAVEPEKFFDLKRIRLINKNLDIDVSIERETVIGRKEGALSNIFQNYGQVSSRHLLLKPDDEKKFWLAIDLNSSNGSKLNGENIKAGKEYKIKKGDFLTIANIEFYVDA